MNIVHLDGTDRYHSAVFAPIGIEHSVHGALASGTDRGGHFYAAERVGYVGIVGNSRLPRRSDQLFQQFRSIDSIQHGEARHV